MKEFETYKGRIIKDYEKVIMEAIKDVNFSGELNYNRLNGYMFLRVDKNFASKCSL